MNPAPLAQAVTEASRLDDDSRVRAKSQMHLHAEVEIWNMRHTNCSLTAHCSKCAGELSMWFSPTSLEHAPTPKINENEKYLNWWGGHWIKVDKNFQQMSKSWCWFLFQSFVIFKSCRKVNYRINKSLVELLHGSLKLISLWLPLLKVPDRLHCRPLPRGGPSNVVNVVNPVPLVHPPLPAIRQELEKKQLMTWMHSFRVM